MAIQRERLNRKNASGEYDTIHLETQADLVLMASDPSKNVEQVLGETVAIAKGGTGGTTAAAGLYNLMAGLTEMTAEELAEDDLLCVLDVDTNSAKKIALSVVGIGGGGTTNPELPDKGSLTLGNTVTFADKQWIVSHVTNTEAYLTLSGLSGNSTWYNLPSACTNFENTLNDAQKACLKNVTAGNTSGKVFVATKAQMDGGFGYFNSDSKRRTGSIYWTSTENGSTYAWYVTSGGSFDSDYNKSNSGGFRPSVCIDLTLYDSGDSGGSEEPVTNPNWPNKADLVVGNTINWAGHDWIVSHIVVTNQDVSNVKAVEAYLTLSDLLGRYTWNYLQDACTTFANSSLTEAQRGCLKSVTAGNTSGKVFVATYGQMDGGFSYFNSNSRRRLRSIYWTSSQCDEVDAWRVDSFGSCNYTDKSTSYGFRPSVCVDLTLYDSGDSGGGSDDVPTKDDFTVGESISFAGKQWIVAHVTDTEVYLAYPITVSTGTWLNLQDPCTEFSNELTGEDKEHLKYIQTERTSGIVFIPSVGQLSYSGSPMDTNGFEYFNCDDRRATGERYWTSTEYTQSSADNLAYFIDDDGSIQSDLYNTNQFDELGIRPFVCIDLTSYT